MVLASPPFVFYVHLLGSAKAIDKRELHESYLVHISQLGIWAIICTSGSVLQVELRANHPSSQVYLNSPYGDATRVHPGVKGRCS